MNLTTLELHQLKQCLSDKIIHNLGNIHPYERLYVKVSKELDDIDAESVERCKRLNANRDV